MLCYTQLSCSALQHVWSCCFAIEPCFAEPCLIAPKITVNACSAYSCCQGKRCCTTPARVDAHVTKQIRSHWLMTNSAVRMQVIAGLEPPAVELKPAAAPAAQPPMSPSQAQPQPARPAAAAPAAPAANAANPAAPRKRVQIVTPVTSQRGPSPAVQTKPGPAGQGPRMPPR